MRKLLATPFIILAVVLFMIAVVIGRIGAFIDGKKNILDFIE